MEAIDDNARECRRCRTSMMVSLDSSAMSSSFASPDCVDCAVDTSELGFGKREIKKERGVEALAGACLRRDMTT